MEKLNFKDYKVVVFNKDKIIFKGLYDDNTTHADYLRDFIDEAIKEGKFNNDTLERAKSIGVLNYMVSVVMLLTGTNVVLNTGDSIVLLINSFLNKESIDGLKTYSDSFDECSSMLIEKVYIDEANLPTDIPLFIDGIDDLKFSERIDLVYKNIKDNDIDGKANRR